MNGTSTPRAAAAIGRRSQAGVAAIATALVVAAAGLHPQDATAVVTFGSNLQRPPDVSAVCAPVCTQANYRLPFGLTAPGRLSSPVNGTVVSWRIRAGADVSPVALRVLRRSPGSRSYLGVGTSALVTPSPNSISVFSTSLPITEGDELGIDCCSSPGAYFRDTGGFLSGLSAVWNTRLLDGTMRAADEVAEEEVLISADVEPSAEFEHSRPKPLPNGKLKVKIWGHNSGTMVVGDRVDRAFGLEQGKKRPKLLQRVEREAPGAGGLYPVELRPTRAARRMLRDRNRLKLRLAFAFTPTGGTTAIETTKTRLKD